MVGESYFVGCNTGKLMEVALDLLEELTRLVRGNELIYSDSVKDVDSVVDIPYPTVVRRIYFTFYFLRGSSALTYSSYFGVLRC